MANEKIAAVTEKIRRLLYDGVVSGAVRSGLGDCVVTALPLDRVSTSAEERCQINLFLYHVVPFSSFHGKRGNSGTGHSVADGGATPLALSVELVYLLTVFGREELQAETMMGYAMEILNGVRTMRSSDVYGADCSNEPVTEPDIRITPQFLAFDEMSKLWSALQTKYRLSMVYHVSPVLICACDTSDTSVRSTHAPSASR